MNDRVRISGAAYDLLADALTAYFGGEIDLLEKALNQIADDREVAKAACSISLGLLLGYGVTGAQLRLMRRELVGTERTPEQSGNPGASVRTSKTKETRE